MLGIINFDILWFLDQFNVNVCEWNFKIYTSLVSFETYLVSYLKYIFQYKTKHNFYQQQKQQQSFVIDGRETPRKITLLLCYCFQTLKTCIPIDFRISFNQ